MDWAAFDVHHHPAYESDIKSSSSKADMPSRHTLYAAVKDAADTLNRVVADHPRLAAVLGQAIYLGEILTRAYMYMKAGATGAALGAAGGPAGSVIGAGIAVAAVHGTENAMAQGLEAGIEFVAQDAANQGRSTLEGEDLRHGVNRMAENIFVAAGLCGLKKGLKTKTTGKTHTKAQGHGDNTRPYDPRAMEGHLKETYPEATVTSTTLPGLEKKIEGGIKNSGKSSEKKVQWTQREGQEWKEKVVGRAQRTGTPGHAFRSYREAVKEAKKPDTEKVFLDKGYNKATGQKIKSNRRPDVLIEKKDGTFHPREVPSKTDDRGFLKSRNEEALKKLPEHMQGEYKVREIK